jgi:Rrf2 family nitric oxide-sensitive transcriptional repressor
MQLTLYTDYSLRVLIYLAQIHGKSATISELAEFYQISRNHLVKVVHNLGSKGLIVTTRGKHGGMKLARDPGLITIAEVVRLTEPNLNLVECFSPDKDNCVVTRSCGLKGMLFEARRSFMGTLEGYTLADVLTTTIDPSIAPLPSSVPAKRQRVIPIKPHLGGSR